MANKQSRIMFRGSSGFGRHRLRSHTKGMCNRSYKKTAWRSSVMVWKPSQAARGAAVQWTGMWWQQTSSTTSIAGLITLIILLLQPVQLSPPTPFPPPGDACLVLIPISNKCTLCPVSHHGQSGPSPHHHCRSSQRWAKKSLPMQGRWTRQGVPKNDWGLCFWTGGAPSMFFFF